MLAAVPDAIAGPGSIVVTGSHNFFKSASSENDENFIVIHCQPMIAVHYAVNAMQTYSHYRWRPYLEGSEREKRDPFQFLSRKPTWPARRKTGETRRMLAFWRP